ncbi:MAG: hypothetical protein KZY74_09850, partial [Paenibacillaceae bacterium]|nr:hypothetical protein [Paenibacillaceae bacterium]
PPARPSSRPRIFLYRACPGLALSRGPGVLSVAAPCDSAPEAARIDGAVSAERTRFPSSGGGVPLLGISFPF